MDAAHPQMKALWRRERDLNPRHSFEWYSFSDRCLQPLSHLWTEALSRRIPPSVAAIVIHYIMVRVAWGKRCQVPFPQLSLENHCVISSSRVARVSIRLSSESKSENAFKL